MSGFLLPGNPLTYEDKSSPVNVASPMRLRRSGLAPISTTRRKNKNAVPVSYMIIGHACIPSDAKDYIIPAKVTYTTTGICGFSTYGMDTLNERFIQGFFDNDTFYKRSPEDVIRIDDEINRSPAESFNQRKDEEGYIVNDPTYIVVNNPNEPVSCAKYDFIFSYQIKDDNGKPIVWNSGKSGVYKMSPVLKKYKDVMTTHNVEIRIKPNHGLHNTYIKVSQIRKIYENSFYPTPKMVIAKINKRLKSDEKIHVKNPDDMCTVMDFELALNELSLTLGQLMQKLLKQHAKRPIRLYDPLCKVDCESLGTDFRAERENQTRRRNRAETKMAKLLIGESLLKAINSRSRSRSLGGKTRKIRTH